MMTRALPVTEPSTVHPPVKLPAVVCAPEVMFATVRSVVTFALAIEAFEMLALALIVIKFVVTRLADTLLVAAKLLHDIFPVTLTFPNVVVPPDDVEVSDNQFDAEVVPSAGQTYNVLLLVLNQS